MRDNVAMQHCLSLAEPVHKMIPVMMCSDTYHNNMLLAINGQLTLKHGNSYENQKLPYILFKTYRVPKPFVIPLQFLLLFNGSIKPVIQDKNKK